MDMPSKYQHSSVVSKVNWFYQPDTPPEAEVDNASTSALAGATGDLIEAMDTRIDATMDASWVMTSSQLSPISTFLKPYGWAAVDN